MPTYNELSFYLQFTINLTLLTGVALFLKRGKQVKKLLLIFLLGEFALELSDLVFRLLKVNTVNIYIYPISQCFGLLMMTEIYNKYFFKIPRSLKWIIYAFAGLSLIINFTYQQNTESVTFYSNIITNIFICSFAAVYFLNVIRKSRIDKTLFIVNVFIFLFFSIESIISTTFNFLINNHLEWVAPVWLFRGVLLWFFYIAFINLGCRAGKMKVW
ncbi:hypothetical protein SAMN05421841_0722 [Chryseobacterium wanjuense]|uniref:YhhN-like protein n=1 Tax=Chryseobacterium wanjuense TaxID=356305 RepID=A0A1I0NPQ5_9FLAO|nr:hypothetical protein [Chryseobacterium wanjuense]SEW03352.1 hypothetical protein SAMN05421841_0722 [Chryseobacterium wanjuense]